MKGFFRHNLALTLSIIFLITLFLPILQMYFIQDEWHNFGFLIYNIHTYGFWRFLLRLPLLHIPVTQLFNTLNYSLFGIQNTFPAIAVLFLIICNSLFWYRNLLKISKSKIIALGSLLFGYTSPIALESISWVSPAVANQLAFLFMNQAMHLVIVYAETAKKKYLAGIFLFTLLALFSKYNMVFLLLFLPCFYFLYLGKKPTITKKQISIFLFIGISLIIINIFGISKYFEVRLHTSRLQITLNAFILPIKSVIQILIPYPPFFRQLTEKIITSRYQHSLDLYTISILLTEIVTFIVSFFTVVFLGLLTWIIKPKRISIGIFSLCLLFFSFLPYIFDAYSTGTDILPSRYYAIGAFAVGVFLFWLFEELIKKTSRSVFHLALVLVFFTLLSVAIFTSSISIKKEITQDITSTQKRKEILSFLTSTFGTKTSTSFILFAQDKNFYIPDAVNATGLRFQTGVFYPFLILLDKTAHISPALFKDNALWNVHWQGTVDNNGHTLGFFYDYQKLLDCVRQHLCQVENIYSVTFDYENVKTKETGSRIVYELQYVMYKDTTTETRERIMSELNSY